MAGSTRVSSLVLQSREAWPMMEEANRKREQPVRGLEAGAPLKKKEARWLEQSERRDGQRSMGPHCEGSLSLEGLSLRL